MKQFILGFFLLGSFSALASDICFTKVTVINSAFGQSISGVTEEGTTYQVSLSGVRCPCVENLLVESISGFLVKFSTFKGINEKTVCLTNPDVVGDTVTSASGFYLK